VGRAEPRRVDVRVIAATHGNLDDAVRAGGFRADLLARLAGWTLRVPPLRDRREDVLTLAQACLARYAAGVRMSTSCAEALLSYSWPFNVRELEQTLAAAAVRVHDGVLRPAHLPEPIARPLLGRSSSTGSDQPEPPLQVRVAPDAVPDAAGLRVVADHFGGNVAQIAAYFGKDRKQVYRWAEKLGVDLGAARGGPEPQGTE
jgi:DNA-binding NtrC family response regulator